MSTGSGPDDTRTSEEPLPQTPEPQAARTAAPNDGSTIIDPGLAAAMSGGECLGTADTLDGERSAGPLVPAPGALAIGSTTILPRIERTGGPEPRVVREARPRLEVYKRLGEGGAGAVDLARDNDIQRLVAVKWLKYGEDDPEALLRFADEVRMVGHLEHPNIVPIHDVGRSDEGRYYFVMKHVQGETLESVIGKLADGDPEYHRRYSFEYRTNLFREILKAVELAHHNGIIHRDLKPSNIMIGPHGEVMVMDWGIARHVRNGRDEVLRSRVPPAPGSSTPEETGDDAQGSSARPERLSTTRHDTIIGTPMYMSPEQVRGKADAIDERSDIYSLCALFYELLALEPYIPPKDSVENVLRAVLTTTPRPPIKVKSPYQPPVPPELNHFVLKGLAKHPGDRFQTVVEMRDRLERIDEGYIPVQCPLTFSKRALHAGLHLIDRHPVCTLVFVVTLGIAVVGGSIALATLALIG